MTLPPVNYVRMEWVEMLLEDERDIGDLSHAELCALYFNVPVQYRNAQEKDFGPDYLSCDDADPEFDLRHLIYERFCKIQNALNLFVRPDKKPACIDCAWWDLSTWNGAACLCVVNGPGPPPRQVTEFDFYCPSFTLRWWDEPIPGEDS